MSDNLDAVMKAASGLELGAGDQDAGTGGKKKQSYPNPLDYKGSRTAEIINRNANLLDPRGEAAHQVYLGETYTALMVHYSPELDNIHPGWWAAMSTVGFAGVVAFNVWWRPKVLGDTDQQGEPNSGHAPDDIDDAGEDEFEAFA